MVLLMISGGVIAIVEFHVVVFDCVSKLAVVHFAFADS